MKLTRLLMENHMLTKKIKGCLLGSLMGDCLGAPFEGEPMGEGSKFILQKYFDKLESTDFEGPQKSYTDDTAMTKCITQSLIDKKKLDPEDLAKKFAREFFKDPNRGYGESVPEVFSKLRARKFEDLFRPAKEQFGGSGSYGNGGAMRIAPIALFYHDDYDNMIKAAKVSTEITHGNRLGINGAILQCIATHQSLLLDPKEKLDTIKFCTDLIEKISRFENEDRLEINDVPYQRQLKEVQDLIQNIQDAYDEKVIEKLGTSVAALYSVPTAIYCFLRAQSEIKNIKTENPFRRTLQYAISLGGDTDTIASMAGSIAGAYYGDDVIDKNLIRHCEDSDVVVLLAEQMCQMFKVNVGKTSLV